MKSRHWVALAAWVLASVVAAPDASHAQTGSGITGIVRDSTGGVIPGVMVSTSSPALIEQTQSAVTDIDGRYTFVDLRPGAYRVDFDLPGFTRVVREGVQLTSGFTATVNAELSLATVQEEVTVIGGAPIVDVQNVVRQEVVSRQIMNSIPTARNFNAYAALMPGVKSNVDVGGTRGEHLASLAIHGSRPFDMQYDLDGMAVHSGISRGGGNIDYYANNGSIEEIALQVGGMNAESEIGGLRVNMIPKDGGNTFRMSFESNGSHDSLQADNLDDELRAAGVNSVTSIAKMWDVNPSLGGPIATNKLWFNASFRSWGSSSRASDIYTNLTPDGPSYTPDVAAGRPISYRVENASASLRLTWQASQRNRFTFFADESWPCFCLGYSPPSDRSSEATEYFRTRPNRVLQASVSSTLSSRLLFQAGASTYRGSWASEPQPGVPLDRMSITELSTNFTIGSSPTYRKNPNMQANYRASLTYVTGAHDFKVGMSFMHAYHRPEITALGDMNRQLLRGVPVSVRVYAPLEQEQRIKANLGLYVQDQWRIKQLTLSAGLRFDYLNGYVPAQTVPAGRFVPERSFAAVEDVPNWRDISPRFGASYDLSGDGRTALKFYIGRFVLAYGANFAVPANPVSASVSQATRPWTDANNDLIPQEEELGPLSDSGFGGIRVTTRYDDEVRQGFGTRPYNWEGSLGIQHEVSSELAVSGAYYRRWYGNHTVLDNVLVNAETDYDHYCLTAPVNSSLPGGGGYEICDLYDITPSKFGQFDSVVVPASRFGEITEYWHGVDLTADLRLPNGVRLSGGISTGKTVFDNCSLSTRADNPAGGTLPAINSAAVTVGGGFTTEPSPSASPSTRFCHQETPFLTQVKLTSVVPLPWSLRASASLQNLPGPEIRAQYVATTAEIALGLGRPLAGRATTATIELIAPDTVFGPRTTQLDFRVSRSFMAGRMRVQPMLDLYNALNSNATLTLNTRYGSQWLRPTRIMDGRIAKLGVQVDF